MSGYSLEQLTQAAHGDEITVKDGYAFCAGQGWIARTAARDSDDLHDYDFIQKRRAQFDACQDFVRHQKAAHCPLTVQQSADVPGNVLLASPDRDYNVGMDSTFYSTLARPADDLQSVAYGEMQVRGVADGAGSLTGVNIGSVHWPCVLIVRGGMLMAVGAARPKNRGLSKIKDWIVKGTLPVVGVRFDADSK